jgi:ABC-2 type transport system ATP-binding protein
MSALKIQGLTKVYRNKVQALKGIDLTVKQGDFFALLGPNGAGKSTTISIVSSLVKKTTGTVEITGLNIDQFPEKARMKLGVVPQEFNFGIFDTVISILINQAGYFGIKKSTALDRAEVYLTKLGLWEKRNSPAGMLSGGMKRRLMIARSLIHEPDLLILDEPTAGVDIELRRSMWDFVIELNQKGKTIILTTHYLEEAENLCKNIAIIDNGLIVENTSIKELLSRTSSQSYILDVSNIPNKLLNMDGCQFTIVDSTCIEVSINKDIKINSVFEFLSKQNIEVFSLKNKSNRLEELFLKLVEKKL